MKSGGIIRVGLTGGIGSGKSVVGRLFGMLGAACYDSDANARRLMTYDEDLAEQIKKSFGRDIYTTQGEIDRQALASRVFADKASLERLNSLVHPAVMRDFESWSDGYQAMYDSGNYGSKYVLMESAIIFDHNLNRFLDKVITVSAPPEVRIRRAVQRGMDRDTVEGRIANQLSDCNREVLADFRIVNDDRQLVWPQIVRIDVTLNYFAEAK